MIRCILKTFFGGIFSVKMYLQKWTFQVFFQARNLIFLPNGLYLPTKEPWGCPSDRFWFHPFILTPYLNLLCLALSRLDKQDLKSWGKIKMIFVLIFHRAFEILWNFLTLLFGVFAIVWGMLYQYWEAAVANYYRGVQRQSCSCGLPASSLRLWGWIKASKGAGWLVPLPPI